MGAFEDAQKKNVESQLKSGKITKDQANKALSGINKASTTGGTYEGNGKVTYPKAKTNAGGGVTTVQSNTASPGRVIDTYSDAKWDDKTRTITAGGKTLIEGRDFSINPSDNRAYFVGGATTEQRPDELVDKVPKYDPEENYDKYKSTIDKMYDTQRKAQLAQLYASRDKAVGELGQQRSKVEPTYTNMKNQADVTNFQAARKLKEVMAAQGLANSGNNVTGQVALDAARQQTLGNMNLQQQQELADIDRRTADLYNPADENALVAAIEAQRSQALMNAMIRAEDVAYKQQQDAIQNAYQRAGLTGLLDDGTKTLQGLSYDRGVLESDRNYDRGVYEFDATMDFNRDKFEEDVRQFGVQEAMERAKLNAQIARDRADSNNISNTEAKTINLSNAQQEIYNELARGTPLANVEALVIKNAAKYTAAGVDPYKLVDYAWYVKTGATKPKSNE